MAITHQAINIRLNYFDPVPKITATSEVCCVCGMLCKLNGVPLPDVKTSGELKEYTLSNIRNHTDRIDKLVDLLKTCAKESEPLTDIWIQTIKDGYDNE